MTVDISVHAHTYVTFSYILGLSYIFPAPSSSSFSFFKQHLGLNSAQTDRTVILYKRSVGRLVEGCFGYNAQLLDFFSKPYVGLYKTQDKNIKIFVPVLKILENLNFVLVLSKPLSQKFYILSLRIFKLNSDYLILIASHLIFWQDLKHDGVKTL